MSDEDIVRISVEVKRGFRDQLKSALAGEGQDVSGWVRKEGQSRIDAHREKMKEYLVKQ